jgi:HEAT repeat protein
MSHPNLEHISAQLQSSQVKDRVLAMIELQKETMPVENALPLIKQALLDGNIQVRGMAAFSLGIKPSPENLEILVQILDTDSDHNMRAIAAGALGYLADQRALTSLRHAFYEDTHWLVQFSAAVALGNLQGSQAKAVLLEALDSPNTLLQEAGIMALGEIGAIDVLERLLPFAHSKDWMIRRHLAEALGNFDDVRSQTTLKALEKDSNPQVVEAAQRSLSRLAKLL